MIQSRHLWQQQPGRCSIQSSWWTAKLSGWNSGLLRTSLDLSNLYQEMAAAINQEKSVWGGKSYHRAVTGVGAVPAATGPEGLAPKVFRNPFTESGYLQEAGQESSKESTSVTSQCSRARAL